MKKSILLILLTIFMFQTSCNDTIFHFGDNGKYNLPDGSLPDIIDSGTDADAEPCLLPEEETCDGKDNDCDGVVDNGFDLQNDPSNCGECGRLCNFPYAISSCVEGECVMGACYPGHHDLNGQESDGCEYGCFETNEGIELCDGIDNNCDGNVDETFDFDNDPNNCGGCSNVCVFLHGAGACENSQCTIGYCTGGYLDADGDPDNGCECRLDTVEGATPCTEGTTGTCGVGEICADIDGDGQAHCAVIPAEICDLRDNDCDGLVDADDDLSADSRVGLTCYGDPDGICAEPSAAGTTSCVNGIVECAGPNLIGPNQVAETCNGLDDDCDGIVDDNTAGSGVSCGTSSNYPCRLGTMTCTGGVLQCLGAINPTGAETCNGIDDDCNGIVDDNPSDAGGACDVRPAAPVGATSPCQAGTLTCTGGVLQCLGSVGPTSTVDSCGVDANCDGVLNNQPDLLSNIANCGSCGNDCRTGTLNENVSCVNGICINSGCKTGYYNIDGLPGCEYPCFYNGTEQCNGIDDDCDGQIDEVVDLTIPSPTAVCGVSPSAVTPECTTGVSVTCSGGSWQCSFPAGVCNPTCAAATEICDTLDNDCDGNVNENVPQYGKSCNSDDGLPWPGHGACRTSGTFVCNGPNAVTCSAVKGSCEPNCEELCDGIDNDCDGLVDEYKNTNVGDSYFVRPDVVQTGSFYIMQYEASRNNATSITAGTGNGYTCSSGCSPLPNAPAGKVLDETPACSVPDRIPWFNVTPIEVEQACAAIGGRACTTDEWKSVCHAGSSCTYGYGTSCTSVANASRFCNLGYYDFDSGEAGNQDGLLPTASPFLDLCFAEWGAEDVYDITGNLREITKTSSTNFTLMGGSFMSAMETGATCDYDFYMVDNDFQLWDTGFRCCFDTDPR
ncbi:hypothetical protein KKF34_10135 [Myxococcota bacterium]|nr:hypothetical protein [Myxococcota bacterium]MBU1381220.1 hypothetical protein [Myxococcota bacterium]MBU1497225.1 hypothetical protein [Myxococcota bacterium]